MINFNRVFYTIEFLCMFTTSTVSAIDNVTVPIRQFDWRNLDYSVFYSPDENHFFVKSKIAGLMIESETETIVRRFASPEKGSIVIELALSYDGTKLLTRYYDDKDGNTCLWNTATGEYFKKTVRLVL